MRDINENDEFYNRYIDYLERREFAKPLRTLPVTARNIPEYKMLFNELDWMLSCLEHLQELDEALQRCQSRYRMMEYQDSQYRVIIPDSIYDIYNDAEQQNLYLSRKIMDICNGFYGVAFMRRVNEPEKSFFTMRLEGAEITGIVTKNSRPIKPESDEMRWIEKYALRKGIYVMAECYVEDYPFDMDEII